jgi:hypothetical protein
MFYGLPFSKHSVLNSDRASRPNPDELGPSFCREDWAGRTNGHESEPRALFGLGWAFNVRCPLCLDYRQMTLFFFFFA